MCRENPAKWNSIQDNKQTFIKEINKLIQKHDLLKIQHNAEYVSDCKLLRLRININELSIKSTK